MQATWDHFCLKEREYSQYRNMAKEKSVEAFKIEDLVTNLRSKIPKFKSERTMLDVSLYTRGSWILKKTKSKKALVPIVQSKKLSRKIVSYDETNIDKK